MATLTPEQLEDALRADQRAHNQTVRGEIAFAAENIEQLRKIKPPSLFWYYNLVFAALLADVFDIAEAVCLLWTGGGCGVVSIPVSVAIGLIFITIGYFQNRPVKRIRKPSENIIGMINKLDSRIGLYRQVIAAAYREGRKIGKLRRPIRFVARNMGAITKLTRGTFRQTVLKNIIQWIPILDLWPWQYSSVRRTHKNRQEAYKEAQRLMVLYEQTQRAERQAFSIKQEAEYAAGTQIIQEEQELKDAA